MKQYYKWLVGLCIVCGCSSAHTIRITPNPIERRSATIHSSAMIVLPDSVAVRTLMASVQGGCEGHEFQIVTGQGLVSALSQACRERFDSVVVENDRPTAEECARRHISHIIVPAEVTDTANVLYDIGALHVTITGSYHCALNLTIFDAALKPLYHNELRFASTSSGTGDCHAGAIYLQQAGKAVSTQLRDSLGTVLLSIAR